MTVGIVEWARRARAAYTWELIAADALGRRVATTPDLAVRLELVGRARRHGWRASQWEVVVPVLHDVDAATAGVDGAVGAALEQLVAAPDGNAALAADDALTSAAVAAWRRWIADADAVADVPYLRAAQRAVHDAVAQGL